MIFVVFDLSLLTVCINCSFFTFIFAVLLPVLIRHILSIGHDGWAERNTYASRITLDWIFTSVVLGKFLYLRPDICMWCFRVFWPSLFVQAKVNCPINSTGFIACLRNP